MAGIHGFTKRTSRANLIFVSARVTVITISMNWRVWKVQNRYDIRDISIVNSCNIYPLEEFLTKLQLHRRVPLPSGQAHTK